MSILAESANLNVLGLLALVGACTYVLVGGPLVLAGGGAVALALIAYR